MKKSQRRYDHTVAYRFCEISKVFLSKFYHAIHPYVDRPNLALTRFIKVLRPFAILTMNFVPVRDYISCFQHATAIKTASLVSLHLYTRRNRAVQWYIWWKSIAFQCFSFRTSYSFLNMLSWSRSLARNDFLGVNADHLNTLSTLYLTYDSRWGIIYSRWSSCSLFSRIVRLPNNFTIFLNNGVYTSDLACWQSRFRWKRAAALCPKMRMNRIAIAVRSVLLRWIFLDM